MKRFQAVVGLALSLAVDGLADGEFVWHVAPPPRGSDLQAGTEPHPFATIQRGIDAAGNGDAVLVAEGHYIENVSLRGMNLRLCSLDASDAGVVARTIIDGGDVGPVVTFAGTEDETCVIAGFTLQHGRNEGELGSGGGGICGGRRDLRTRATIRDNVILENHASAGGGLAFCSGLILANAITNNNAWGGAGLAYCDGRISHNEIQGNRATLGGGMYRCDGMIDHNLIADNLGHGGGGGLLGCDGLIQDNVIQANRTEQDESAGGGLKDCQALIRRNLIAENRSRCDGGGGLNGCHGIIANNRIIGNTSEGMGAGLNECGGLIRNNTIAENRARPGGCGGLSRCDGEIRDCIIWGNTPTFMGQLVECSHPTYSCIQHWTGGGEGNIFSHPYFMDAEEGDYHLTTWSPCADSGDPRSEMSNELDFSYRIDMGAYGNTAESTTPSLDTDLDGLPDDWEWRHLGGLESAGKEDPDGDGIVNAVEWRHGWDPIAASETRVQNLNRGAWFQTLQGAIVEAEEGDELVAHPAVYRENIGFFGRQVVLRSADPVQTSSVTATVIDAQGVGPAVTFAGTEDPTCVLAGFTLCRGTGGVWGQGTQATLQHLRVTQHEGPGISDCNGQIRNCTIWGNHAGYGGGLYECHGVIENCTVADNHALLGGGLHECNGEIRNCIIWGNRAERNPQIFHSTPSTYCCIQEWTVPGEGNVSFEPHFVEPSEGDYHLQPWSPCIDIGEPGADFSREPALNGGRINLGAYGNTQEATARSADLDGDGLPDAWEESWFGDLRYDGDADPDGDSVRNLREYVWAWDPSQVAATRVENVTQGQFYQTIQAALLDAIQGDRLVVYPAVYRENLRFPGRNVTLTSLYASDPRAVGATILDGAGQGPVVTFKGTEDSSCVLSGFTIQNGSSNEAGGIQGENTLATIQYCVVRENAALQRGGGLADCNGLIYNSLITANTAGHGGGLFRCDGQVLNCTIVGNSADWYGAAYQCHAEFRNCILWDNDDALGNSGVWPGNALFSCIEGLTELDRGNHGEDPAFANAIGGDYRLKRGSRCIDAGDPDTRSNGTDLLGRPRVLYGGHTVRVDQGVYEASFVDCTPATDNPGMRVIWSSQSGFTFDLAWSEDLYLWHAIEGSISSEGDQTTSWTDDGSQTGSLPSLAHRRYYRIVSRPGQ